MKVETPRGFIPAVGMGIVTEDQIFCRVTDVWINCTDRSVSGGPAVVAIVRDLEKTDEQIPKWLYRDVTGEYQRPGY